MKLSWLLTASASLALAAEDEKVCFLQDVFTQKTSPHLSPRGSSLFHNPVQSTHYTHLESHDKAYDNENNYDDSFDGSYDNNNGREVEEITPLDVRQVPLANSQQSELSYSPPFYPSPWMDPNAEGWADAYAKARDFVSQLTLLEKVNLTTGTGWMSERCVGNTGSVPRLGLHSLCLQDGPVGLRLSDYNSVFPSGLTAAATFDRGLIYRRAQGIGAEHRDKGVDVVLAPVAGPLGRHPDGGRNWEGFSPDPYLTGVSMAESVRGIQDAGVVACAKHFIVNEQERFRIAAEARGNGFNITESMSSNVDDKAMHELYLWPFADAVRAGVGSIMCSYNQINNSYGCQNSKLLNNLLKDELGFQGFVMSDWQAQHSGASSAAAGLDMTMPGDTVFNSGGSYFGSNLTRAVLNGTVADWRLDDMVLRIMAAYFKVGRTVTGETEINFSSWTRDSEGYVHMFAQEGWQRINGQVDVRDGHAELIREVAAKGTVLLKNTNKALPLKKPKFLAVVGEDAGPNTDGPNGCENRGCNNGTLALAWGSGTAEFPYLITPDSALQQAAIRDNTRYESVLSNQAWAKTEALVKQPNVTAVVFVSADGGEGFITVDGNDGDRKNLTLWNQGDELIQNVSSINPNTIVVIHSIGAVVVDAWYDNPNITAIVWAGLPGQESGNSIADVLYGRVNPAARTPFTWGPSLESYGVEILRKPNNGKMGPQADFEEGVFIDYRHFDRVAPNATDKGAPIYEFGHGLSYTTFEYSNLAVTKNNASPEYTPTQGQTMNAPTFGTIDKDPKQNAFPEGFHKVDNFIYPYINQSSSPKSHERRRQDQNAKNKTSFLPDGATDGSAQPRLASGGQPGGNPRLYDVLYTVTAEVKNTGDCAGDEVPQLYVSLGNGRGTDGEPVRVLRGFDRLTDIAPGASKTFRAELTRRDLSNWDVTKQDWVQAENVKVFVGSSSRKLPLEATLA